jgi:hypothetical protein
MPSQVIQRSKVIVQSPFDTEGIDPAEAAVGTYEVPLGSRDYPKDFPKGSRLTGGPQVHVAWQRAENSAEASHDGWVQVHIENEAKGEHLVSDVFTRRELLDFIRVLRRACAAAFEADE